MEKVTPGLINTLPVLRILTIGAYLDGRESGDILLPAKWLPETAKVGETLDVFIYFDSDDRLIATTLRPLALLGEVALLRAVAVNRVGAFLDWGLEKDLLVPYREQTIKMTEGNDYLVYVFADPATGRLAASARLESFMQTSEHNFQPGDEVDLVIWKQTTLGYKAIINNSYEGVLYSNEIFRPISFGEKTKGYIGKIREDGKIDLSLLKPGYEKIDDLSATLLELLRKHHGFMALTDKSAAGEIYQRLAMSKKNFKKAVGKLYKDRLIDIEEGGIRIIDTHEE